MPITLDGSLGITTPMYNGSITANAVTPSVNMKNRLINSAMVIDQRNAGASVTITTNAEFGVDRWRCQAGSNNRVSLQQNAGSVTPPTGFTNYLGATSLSAFSVPSGESFSIAQYIEGFNTSDLQFGTASAKTVTLSFWVRSSLTGTFSGALANSAVNRSYPFSYTINSANTWEYETITIPGDTAGTWIGSTNGVGLRLWINLGAGSSLSTTGGAWAAGDFRATTGSTSILGTNGATFYITGVQLEVGSTATSFDYRPYGTELALCQRYYWKTYLQSVVPGTAGVNQAGAFMITVPFVGNSVRLTHPYKVNMRAAPTITIYNPETGASGFAAYEGSGATNQVAMGTTFISEYTGLMFATSAGFTGSLYWQAIGVSEL
jgi:hypothetical protein